MTYTFSPYRIPNLWDFARVEDRDTYRCIRCGREVTAQQVHQTGRNVLKRHQRRRHNGPLDRELRRQLRTFLKEYGL